ncbi:MAG: TlpA family protein disulfide reductase [Chloroflexi bacterium]|nr:TlpA family protein disulfide reductase [Chloroflexota bacterium]
MASPSAAHRKTKRIDPYWIILGTILSITLALVVIYLTRDQQKGGSDSAARPPAPDFTLAGLSGDIALSDYRGRYVLINFWATWCPPCMAEMPELYAYYQQHQDDNFVLLGVNVQEDLGTVRGFMQTQGFNFPVAFDSTGMVYQRYGGAGLPSSFLIGPDGTLVKVWEPGKITRKMLDKDVTPRLPI